ncbi:hypothetical protein, partial [Pseudomonas aeruginosa]|uniref:hypothetical protein n=1 Tax=Pseudomonas aeruginosa TaxID=287 RepID=UPI001E4D7895
PRIERHLAHTILEQCLHETSLSETGQADQPDTLASFGQRDAKPCDTLADGELLAVVRSLIG